MAGVLDPEELDALMDSAEAAREGEGKKFDFARQDHALQRLLPALNQLHGNFASAGFDSLAEQVPGLVSVTVDRVCAMRFDELQRSLSAPCSVSVLRGLPDGAAMLLALEAPLVFQMVDRYYGGIGTEVPSREKFSDAEEDYISQVVTPLMQDIGQVWKALLTEPVKVSLQAASMAAVDVFTEYESLVACRFVLNFGGEEDNFGLWVAQPWAALDALAERLGDNSKPVSGGDAQWRQRLGKRLESIPMEFTAVLAETELSLKRVLNFKVGEVIEIPAADMVRLCLEGNGVFVGNLGAQKGNFAVRIEGRCPADDE